MKRGYPSNFGVGNCKLEEGSAEGKDGEAGPFDVVLGFTIELFALTGDASILFSS